MSHEFPRTTRDVLARQTAGDVHPSAGLLNAYAEQSLTAGERSHVLAHLANCAECREVVFLVAGTKEEPTTTTAPQHGFRLQRLWKWAVPVVALIAICSAVLLQHWLSEPLPLPTRDATNSSAQSEGSGGGSAMTSTASPPAPQPAYEIRANSDEAASVRPSAQSARKAATRTSTAASAQDQMLAQLPSSNRDANALTMTPAPPSSVAPAGELHFAARPELAVTAPSEKFAVSTPHNSVQPPRSSGFRAAPAPSAGAAIAGMAPSPASVTSPVALWRITDEGALEVSRSGADWSRVLVDQPADFTVVATVGNSVWVGGRNGMLFHSPDVGNSWQKVTLANEAGTIVSIKFTASQDGEIAIDNRSSWATMDGGVTWTKQSKQ